MQDAYWSQFQSNKSESLIHREFMFFIKMLIAIFTVERSGKNAFPFGLFSMNTVVLCGDLDSLKRDKASVLSTSLQNQFKDSIPANLRICRLFSWKTGKQCICFPLRKKNPLTQTRRERLQYFFSLSEYVFPGSIWRFFLFG